MGIQNFTVFLLLLTLYVDSRPISYSGGSTLMSFSDNMKESIYYHYSPSYKYSVGIEGVKDKVFNSKYSYLRYTYLLDRKNTDISQRNLYFQFGLSSKGKESLFYGIHGDWETRRLFLGFGYKKVENDIKNYINKYYQFGFAPYLGEYGDLHTWIMLKSKKNTLDNKWSSYPVLKFFKGNTLFELGYNDKTEWDMHLMYRF